MQDFLVGGKKSNSKKTSGTESGNESGTESGTESKTESGTRSSVNNLPKSSKQIIKEYKDNFKISVGDKFEHIDGKSILLVIGCTSLNIEYRVKSIFLCNKNDDIKCFKYSVKSDNTIERTIIDIKINNNFYINYTTLISNKEKTENNEDKVDSKKEKFSLFKKKEKQVNSRSKVFFGNINNNSGFSNNKIADYIKTHGINNKGQINIGQLDINDQLTNKDNNLLFVIVSNFDEYTLICDKYFVERGKIKVNNIKITYDKLNEMNLFYILYS